jgi:hypothetical protein
LPTDRLQPQELSPQEDMFQEGVPGSSLSRCHCRVPGACFPPGIVQPLAPGEAVTSCDTALRGSLVEVLPSGRSFSPLLLLAISFSDASGSWGCDNMAVLQRMSAKHPPSPLSHLLHCISLLSAHYGFHFMACPGGVE